MPTLDELRAAGEARLSTLRLNVDDVTQADIDVIVGFLDYFDAQQKQDEEDAAFLTDLQARRARAHLAAEDTAREAAAETTTGDDIDRLNTMTRSRGDVIAALVATQADVSAEFTGGLRCPVCGNTSAQSDAQNYDCTTEC
ncbi:hypothetical protein [Microbacterium sp. 77mftsu3.1]|uniref:hypothetical protein n=1 Tax=Microbacterium sp. 77mftsu3.1 TaxID=1761802 RepID=UPI0003706FC5|nr:hypothetical protein [Microbacterium sp. 77mftsu3.1]SDH38091.1 hypothetical protein SAMN04488590_3185 [Microbacterium sp. 77mftsu3.1]